MKQLIAVLLITFVVIIYLPACNNSPNSIQVKDRIDSVIAATPKADTMAMDKMKTTNPMLKSMMGTMAKMDTLKNNKSIDINFANTMIIHHQAAIDMAQLELATGESNEIKSMAKNIIAAQQAEILEMQKVLSSYKTDYTEAKSDTLKNIFKNSMTTMMTNIYALNVVGSTDDAFVMLMIQHHNSAIQMAKDEIQFGENKNLKQLAAKIIAAQTKEVNQFVAWSTKLKAA